MQKRWDYLIIVTGLPATGKSHFATALERALGLPLLAKDAIKEPLLDVLQPVDAVRSRQLSDLSFALLFLLAPQLPGRGLILEGNFRRGEHEPPLSALQAAAASSVQVLCTVDEAVRRARLAARSDDPARHRGHLDRSAAVATTEAATGQYLDLPGGRLVRDGAAPDSATDALILELAHGLTHHGEDA